MIMKIFNSANNSAPDTHAYTSADPTRSTSSKFTDGINYAKAIADAEKWFDTIPCEPESRNLFDVVLYVANTALKECETLKDQLKKVSEQNDRLKNTIADFAETPNGRDKNQTDFNYAVIKKHGELPVFIRKNPLSVVRLSLPDLIYANTLLAIWCENHTDRNLKQLNDFLNERGVNYDWN